VLEEAFRKEVRVGDPVTLMTRLAGAEHSRGKTTWVFVANGFEAGGVAAPPRQIELNGFLLGQHVRAVDSALGTPFRVIKREGGSHRVYVLDRTTGAYMVFSIDSAGGNVVSGIQVSGPKGTVIRPFLGITLGTPGTQLIERFGLATSADQLEDVPARLLVWAGHNYTVEVDSGGLVNSIRIAGDEGMRNTPDSSETPSLAALKSALRGMNVDSLMWLLAADLEFMRGDSVVTFTRAPRVELEDARSNVRRRLKDVAARLDAEPDQMNLRMYDTRLMSWVYKWERGPIAEMVFRWCPGGFRLWEVKYR
jgi:hypothetical protein